MAEESGSHLLEGMIFGGLIGFGLGVLFAPHTGEKTREMIREKLKRLEMDEVVDRFLEAFEEGRKEAEKHIKEEEE